MLSSFTLRNATGALSGVVAGMWYHQEVGAPDVSHYIAKAEDKVSARWPSDSSPRVALHILSNS
jgi:hypothetical protein